MKLERFRLSYGICALLIAFFGAFLSLRFFSTPEPAFAEDGTPIRSVSEEFFVTIYDQGAYVTVKTGPATVAEVLERSQITIAETDIVEPSLDTTIESDYNINIYRARPAIIIDGIERHYLMTASYDPKQIAMEAGLTVYDGDSFTTEVNTSFLETGAVSTYRVERNGGRTITVEESLPYSTETEYDYNLAKGETYLKQAGEDGRKESVYSVQFQDNVEVSRELTSEEVKSEPVPEIVVVGAKPSIAPEQQTCVGWLREAGVSEGDLEAAIYIIYHESGCRVDAQNASSGAYGIPQALPGEKMASMGADWRTNPITQLRWMHQYVTGRYGGWQQALAFKLERGWY